MNELTKRSHQMKTTEEQTSTIVEVEMATADISAHEYQPRHLAKLKA